MENIVTYSNTQFFQQATFLNVSSVAYAILNSHLDEGWWPENAVNNWTDIAVLDGRYYAVYGEDSVASEANAIYVEIAPTPEMINEYKAIKDGNII